MGISTIDAGMVKKAFLAGAKGLEAKKDWINELNVFPVPDGDTGTNMTMTIMAAAKAVAELEDPDMEQLAKAISSGSLRGARGNSGVILSQLLRGFTKEIKTVDEIDTTTLANAMVRGTETAYKAVMKPKEGTILTVAKGMADKALEMAAETDDIETFAQAVIKEGDRVLNLTPEMLPVLKQAGVVDSGGQGLMQVIKGAFDGLTGNVTDFTLDGAEAPANGAAEKTVQTGNGAARTDIDTADIKYGYCTEFIIKLEKKYTDEDEEELKKYLGSIGDSLVVVSDDEIVKIHVHTNHPGQAFERALTYGQLSRMKIDNMREEHQEKLIKDAEKLAKEQAENKEPPKDHGFISVSVGEGLSQIFRELGVDYLIEGGQTMNPSTEDMLNAIEKVNAKTIYIFPNNKNIILAANQARDLTEDKEIIVVPTKTIPQGISAMISFVPEKGSEENLASMTDAISRVKTGQITYAVRDTRIDDKEIHEGDIMGIGDAGILAVGRDRLQVAEEMVAEMVDEESEIISVYYGEDVSEEDAEALSDSLTEKYPECEVELNQGGQPIYYYLISVE
mgnify:CR=1 FL=1